MTEDIVRNAIITITDGISPTSMPYNEFVLYRKNKKLDEQQILILLFKGSYDKSIINIPTDVKLFCVGKNVIKLRSLLCDLEKNYNVKAYHIHEGKSVIMFSIASLLRLRSKAIYTLHSTYKNYPFHNKLFSFCASILAKKVVCVSRTSYKYYPSILKFLRGKDAMSIQNGVDIDRIDAAGDAYDTTSRPFTMVYVARLVPLKRHYILFNVLKQLPNVHLDLIGQGPLASELKVMVKDLGIENQVSFKGLLPREEVYRQLKSADLYVSTSSYEGLPIGVLEAMGCGAPCLVTNIEQHTEISEKCTSLITLPADVNLWVEKISELVEMDKTQLRQIGIMNRKSVSENFSLESMHLQYDKLYYR